jgi:hypothetical protein
MNTYRMPWPTDSDDEVTLSHATPLIQTGLLVFRASGEQRRIAASMSREPSGTLYLPGSARRAYHTPKQHPKPPPPLNGSARLANGIC